MQILPDFVFVFLLLLLRGGREAGLEHCHRLRLVFLKIRGVFFAGLSSSAAIIIAGDSLLSWDDGWGRPLLVLDGPVFGVVLLVDNGFVVDIELLLLVLVGELRDFEAPVVDALFDGFFLDFLLLDNDVFAQFADLLLEFVVVPLEVDVQLPFWVAAQTVDLSLLDLVQEVVRIELFPHRLIVVQIEEKVLVVLLLLFGGLLLLLVIVVVTLTTDTGPVRVVGGRGYAVELFTDVVLSAVIVVA